MGSQSNLSCLSSSPARMAHAPEPLTEITHQYLWMSAPHLLHSCCSAIPQDGQMPPGWHVKRCGLYLFYRKSGGGKIVNSKSTESGARMPGCRSRLCHTFVNIASALIEKIFKYWEAVRLTAADTISAEFQFLLENLSFIIVSRCCQLFS